MNNITNANYRQAKSFWEDSETKSCSKYHTLYVRSDIVLLVNVFENFRNMCLEIYEFDPAQFFTATKLAWKAVLKKTELKLEL